ncbi:MAG: hypothetical protein AB7T49_12655 [Oligoflexales bacterium]
MSLSLDKISPVITHLTVFLCGIYAALFGFQQVDSHQEKAKSGLVEWTRPTSQFGPHVFAKSGHAVAVFIDKENAKECRLHKEIVRYTLRNNVVVFNSSQKIALENDFRKILTSNRVRVIESKEFEQLVRCGARAKVSFN